MELTKEFHRRDTQRLRLNVASERLYGRDSELKILRNLLTKTVSREDETTRHIVWIHGRSGCGKTALCQQALAENNKDNKMLFIEGKYNQLFTSTTTPYSAIIAAFDKLGKLTKGYEKEMKDCLKFEGTILTRLIPSFSQYATDALNVEEDSGDNANTASSLMLASERLAVAFRSFLRECTAKVLPLCIFLDDLQWSDRYSQELIASIAHDEGLTNFMLIGAFRDEDAKLTTNFLNSMEDLAKADGIVTDMPLHDLDLPSVNSFLARILSQETDTTLPLARIVHRKTNGNPYFVIQLLNQLESQNFLTFNFSSLKWEWDIEMANAGTDVSENVVDVVTRRIKGIPERVQRILKLAACLGFFVDIELLRRLELGLGRLNLMDIEPSERQISTQESLVDTKVHTSSGATSLTDEMLKENMEIQLFEASLQRAEEEAFVERAGSVMKFSHDRIQQVVYDVIELGCERDMLHYQIGRYLQRCHDGSKDANEFSRFLFLAVDQLNRGSRLINDDKGRLSLIEMNFLASKVAKQQGGIEAVALFLRKAIELVHPSFWLYHYELILEVYNSSAEVDFSLGMMEEAKATLQVIMANAIRDVDRVRALVVEFEMLGLQCQYKEAITHGIRLLRLLGERVPKKISLLHVAFEYFKARMETKNKPDEFFTNLRPTESTNIEIVQKVLRVGSVYGWNGDINFAGFAMLRGFRSSLKHGASASTPYLYSGYGFMLGLFGDYEEAFRFGQLALQTRRGKETFPSAVNLTYSNLVHLQLPLGVALEPYLSAYRVGLETGNLFHGSICLACYALIYVNCGLPLGTFAGDMRNFADQLKICHQDLPLAFILPTHQLALNLMGMSDDPLDLSRDAIVSCHKDLFSDNLLLCNETSRVVPADILYTWYLQLYNAYILQDVVMAVKTLNRILNLKKAARRFGGTHMMNYFLPFIDGLVGLWLSREKHTRNMGRRVSKAAIVELTKISKTRPVNSVTPLQLLLAEMRNRNRTTSVEEARKAYNEAISKFSRSGLNHFAAIANELAGKSMLEKNDSYWGKLYLEAALKRWDEYDAAVKVELMVKEHPFLEPTATDLLKRFCRGNNIQGRSRFDVMMDSFRSTSVTSQHSNRSLLSSSFRGSFRRRASGNSSPHSSLSGITMEVTPSISTTADKTHNMQSQEQAY